jgi:glycosyltransferase involved in cell wall biosynthesis
MRILIDLLALAPGGGHTYTAEMLPRLALSSHEIAVLIRQNALASVERRLPGSIKIMIAPEGTANPFRRYIYQRTALPGLLRQWSAAVLFVPGGLTGYRPRPRDRVKLVAMLQNMLPFDAAARATYSVCAYPSVRLRLALLTTGLLASLGKADRVIYVSQHCAEVLSPRLRDADSALIPHGISANFLSPALQDIAALTRAGIRRPFVLYVSSIEPYKHQDIVLEGFEKYLAATPRSELQLVFAGPAIYGGRYSKNLVRRAAQSHNVVLAGRWPHSELPSLLQHAEALLFASTCEACPLTLLEYLASGRPIVCSRSPPMPEFAGDAARYVDAEDAQEWTKALSSLLGSLPELDGLSKKARVRANAYTWEETARRTLAALTEW